MCRRGREKEREMDEDEGNIVTTWPHMVKIEKGEEGERRQTEVTAVPSKQGRGGLARRSGSRRRRQASMVADEWRTELAGSRRNRWWDLRWQQVPTAVVVARWRGRGGAV